MIYADWWTDHDILMALRDACPIGFPYPGDDYDYAVELDGVVHKIVHDRSIKPPPDRGYAHSWMWAERKGKPWEDVLEEIVRRSFEARTYAVGL